MITIYFEAHGTTLDNEQKISSGWNDVALSPLGERQARELGERYAHTRLDAVFCSDLQRAYETARLAFDTRLPIIQDVHLRECNYGQWNGAPKQQVEAYKETAITAPYPDGESYQDTSHRMKIFLERLLGDYDGKTALIIGHRATQYGLEEWINHIPLRDAVLAPWKWQPGWKYQLTSVK
ncbi:MAG TPA: histidine phosphatase family protein [Candidatus Saccharimonadales bacterium]|nr:histidine phosphatase family protein [Candidatus Saccharimonadales bacterium]